MPLSQFPKKETRDQHQRLDAKVNLDFQAGDGILQNRYGQFLQATYRFVQAVELPLNQALPTLGPEPWHDETFRLPALKRDLLHLQLALPADSDPVSFVTLPQALGAFYVLEGSALGGHVIYKYLRKVPSLAAQCHFHYHGVSGETLAKRWRMVTAVLDRWIGEADYAEAGSSARQTFALFERGLDLQEP